MSTFDHLPASRPAPRQSKNQPVFCVGWNAFVDWPHSSEGSKQVPLVDATGRPLPNDLADGQEVEILAWRPRSREGTAYQVRRLADRSEWWIAGTFLRRRRS
ncbi:MAG: hypothetical protein ACRERC_20890 [Candidatus Binatia bacterium]